MNELNDNGLIAFRGLAWTDRFQGLGASVQDFDEYFFLPLSASARQRSHNLKVRFRNGALVETFLPHGFA